MTGARFAAFLAVPVFLGVVPAQSQNLRQSGTALLAEDTRAMQTNDRANPAMFWVKEGEQIWSTAPGEGGKSCAGCHGPAASSMRGVATRYPANNSGVLHPLDLSGRIQACRTGRQQAAAWPQESRPLLAITSYVALQSRGLPIMPPAERGLQAHIAAGAALFQRRIGQLDLSCAQCHDDNWGKSLGGSLIPQAHPTGYPIYRLEWQGVGSLQRRLRTCMAGVRAEPYAYGAPELIDLEIYLMQRAAGMTLETPAVRP